jgi:SNF2-related domain
MRPRSQLYAHQERLASWMYQRDCGAVIAPMGGGKTASAGTAVHDLLDGGEIRHALILAPLRVANLVWPAEFSQWEHLSGLRFVVLSGGPRERARLLATAADREVTICGLDNTQWLVGELAKLNPSHPLFDCLIVDEISKFKSPASKRARALMKLAGRFRNRFGLTGTPRPNGPEDLFMPAALLTDGKLWGASFTRWQRERFRPLDRNGWRWAIEDEWAMATSEQFGRIAIQLAAEDMPDLPDLSIVVHPVALPDDVWAHYRTMQKTALAEIDGKAVEAVNAAVISGKLAQFVAGFAYSDDGRVLDIHRAKDEWLDELVEGLDGQPIIVVYEYLAQLARLRGRFGEDLPVLGAGSTARQAETWVAAWNRGAAPVLALHVACLHADTEVLTEHRGWVRIVDVREDERVSDGVAYVSHKGCTYSGIRPVVDVFGIKMTPEHKLLVSGKWERAIDVRDRDGARAAALFKGWEADEIGGGSLPAVRQRGGKTAAKRTGAQSAETNMLRGLSRGPLSSHDRFPTVQYMVEGAPALREILLARVEALWRAGDRHVSGMVGEFRGLLARYGTDLLRRFDTGANRRERLLCAGKLPLGVEYGATGEQAKQSHCRVSGREDASQRADPTLRSHEEYSATAPQQRNDRRRGGERRAGLDLRQGAHSETWAHVYDLVECGPRNRFLIRNAAGEIFISHNSGGHGLNLQFGGHHMAWLAPCWSPEGWEQTLKRIHRPGQQHKVTIHVASVAGSVDELKRLRVIEKMSAAEAFRRFLEEV